MATQSCSSFYFENASKAITWFNRVAQFETLFRVDTPDGKVLHSELRLGPVIIMLGDSGKEKGTVTVAAAGGQTGGLYIVMRDDDALKAHYEHAKSQDAGSIDKHPFKTDYGSLDYSLVYEGQKLYFGTYAPHTQPTKA